MNIFLYSLYIIFAIVDALSPVLGYSFYRDSSGAWHDNLYLKPFTIAYGIYMAFIFFLLLYYHKRIPTSLFHMLVIVQFICVFLVCAENHFGGNTLPCHHLSPADHGNPLYGTWKFLQYQDRGPEC